jgi:hypothetical protein
LPFEPKKSRKQAERKAEARVAKKSTAPSASTAPRKEEYQASKNGPKTVATGIPEAISRRMVKRMAAFCGIPTFLGMSTFLVSYLIVATDTYAIPTYAVLLVSLGFFGLGVLGLSYGALSASWEEETPGSRLGWSEFTTNLGRMTGAWKAKGQDNPKQNRQK